MERNKKIANLIEMFGEEIYSRAVKVTILYGNRFGSLFEACRFIKEWEDIRNNAKKYSNLNKIYIVTRG